MIAILADVVLLAVQTEIRQSEVGSLVIAAAFPAFQSHLEHELGELIQVEYAQTHGQLMRIFRLEGGESVFMYTE